MLKTKVLKDTGVYLAKVKRAVTHTADFLYGKRRSDNAVPKRDRERMSEVSYWMARLLFIRVAGGGNQEEVCELAALPSFQCIDPHNTYALEHVTRYSVC